MGPVGALHVIGEPLEAILDLPCTYQFDGAGSGIERLTDHPGVDGERLVHPVEAEDPRTLQVRRGRKSLLPGHHGPRLLAPRETSRQVSAPTPDEGLKDQPLEAHSRRRDPITGQFIGQRLAHQRTHGHGRHEPDPAHPSPKPRNESIGQPIRERGQTHRIETPLTRHRRVVRRELREGETSDRHDTERLK